MQINRSSLFLEVIEGLSKSHFISDGDIMGMAKEILYKSAHFLKIERVNAWTTSENEVYVHCLLAYDRKKDKFYQETSLNKEEFTDYFQHISKKDFLISNNARTEHYNKSILENYLIPNNIYSMIEVPIISGGKFKGILCFEQTGEPRIWTNDEQHFAIALTHLITLTIETEEKNKYRDELEKAFKEKTLMLNEMNHRVKNNLTIINALIKSESNRSLDNYHKDLFLNLQTKTFTLASLQDFTQVDKGLNEVEFNNFLRQLCQNINETYGYGLNVQIKYNLERLLIDSSKAMPCALIINELLTNCFKYAFSKEKVNNLVVELLKNFDNEIVITISDNGSGLPVNYDQKGNGYNLIYGLIEQIDGNLTVLSSEKGTSVHINFKTNPLPNV
jgi:two-component sensor histidine kinase